MADPPPPSNQAPTCSPLEQEVLDEYALLLDNLNKVRPSFMLSRGHEISQPEC